MTHTAIAWFSHRDALFICYIHIYTCVYIYICIYMYVRPPTPTNQCRPMNLSQLARNFYSVMPAADCTFFCVRTPSHRASGNSCRWEILMVVCPHAWQHDFCFIAELCSYLPQCRHSFGCSFVSTARVIALPIVKTIAFLKSLLCG